MKDVRLRILHIILGISLITLLAFTALSCGSKQDLTGGYEESAQIDTNSIPTGITGCGPGKIWASSGKTIFFYNGSSWTIQYEGEATLWDVYCLDEKNVWAVGERPDNTTVVLFYDGSTWITQSEIKDGGLPLEVYALDEDHVWFTAGWVGIYCYDGQQWLLVQAPDDQICQSITAADASGIWVGMRGGSIYRLDGTVWEKHYESDGLIESMFTLDRYHVWATDWGTGTDRDTGNILFYNGEDWSAQFELENSRIRSVFALDPQHVWASAEYVKGKRLVAEDWYGEITEGHIYFFDGNTWELLWKGNQELEQDMCIHDLYVQDENHLWLTSLHYGLFCLEK